MTENTKSRDERFKELEALAKRDPQEVEHLFREYYPDVAVPEIGSLMIQNIVAHEFQLEPTIFQG